MICNYSIYNKRKKKSIELSLMWVLKGTLKCKRSLHLSIHASMVLDGIFSYNLHITKNCLAKETY